MFVRFPLMSEAADLPEGGGSGDTAVADPPERDTSALAAQWNKVSQEDTAPSAPQGEARGSEEPDESADDGHPVGEGGEAGSGEGAALDPALLDRARMFGLDAGDFAGMSADQVGEHLAMLSRVFVGQLQQPATHAPQQTQPPAQPPAPAAPQQTTQAPAEGSLLASWKPEFLESIDPEIKEFAQGVDALLSSMREEIKGLRALNDHFARQESERIVKQFDQTLDGLGPEWADVLGKSDKLTPQQQQARGRIWDAAFAFGGPQALNDKALLSNLAVGFHADHYRKTLARQISDAVRRQSTRRQLPSAPSTKTAVPALPADHELAGREDLVAKWNAARANDE